MNRVGHLGQGESVWLGFFLHEVLSKFSSIARLQGDQEMVDECLIASEQMADQIEKKAWDGKWYRRAWFDNGKTLGSVRNKECRIDSLPQSWATLSAVGDPVHRDLALDAVWEQLVQPEQNIIKLLTPAFDETKADPGYIKAYPPGVRENGGQYTHGAVWAAMAFVMAGRKEQAEKMISMLNPINHALDPAAISLYKVEPYVVAADVYGQEPHTGRGGWTWYTGAAGWYYRLLLEVMLGVDKRANSLHMKPRIPVSWGNFTLHYRFMQTVYHLNYRQDTEHKGPIRISLDGQLQPDDVLNLVNDKRDHDVDLIFGAD